MFAVSRPNLDSSIGSASRHVRLPQVDTLRPLPHEKSTIYRHWPGKLELVEDAFRTLKASVTVPAEGTLRDRVIEILEQVACLIDQSTYSACMPALIDAAERDPNVRAFHNRFSAERRAGLVGLLRDATASGELPAQTDPEILADALVGPIIMRRLFLGETVGPAIARQLVDQLLPTAGDQDGAATPAP